jgi:prepilin-type N-terminal cleavage/methylation domain-containing protein
MNKIYSNKAFSLLELIIAVALSLIVAASLYQFFVFQNQTFIGQRAALDTQQTGRAAIDFLVRSIQNSGYSLVRGQRFEAAADRYLTLVYDDNEDGVIQSNEVVTYALSKPSGSATESFSIAPYFDQNGNGIVEASETRTYNVPLTLSGPPYNLYKIVPDNSTSNLITTAIALNFDYLLFRYYDENDKPLPVTLDGGGNRIAPTPPYVLSSSERNSIRRVEVELMARARKPDRNYQAKGAYPNYSVATYSYSPSATPATTPRANISYDDNFRRVLLATDVAPRNLMVAPWGRLSIVANPNPVTCPSTQATLTATLVDKFGAAISGASVGFSADSGTISPASSSTTSSGVATTALTYDWANLSKTITVSGSALVDIDPGPAVDNKIIFSATGAYFEGGLKATYFEDFNDGLAQDWTPVSGSWAINANSYYRVMSPAAPVLSVYGCTNWQDYLYLSKQYRTGNSAGIEHGVVVRYTNSGSYYNVRITYVSSSSQTLTIYKRSGAAETLLASAPITESNNIWYWLKVDVQGSTIKAKFWQDGTAEPASWTLQHTDSVSPYPNGQIGVRTNDGGARFDDISLSPIS